MHNEVRRWEDRNVDKAWSEIVHIIMLTKIALKIVAEQKERMHIIIQCGL